MSGKVKSSPLLSEEAQIVMEAVNVITEASEILAKSMEAGKKKKKTKEPLAKKDPSLAKLGANDNEDDDKDENEEKEEGEKEEGEKEEGEKEEGEKEGKKEEGEPSELGKAGDDILGEIPESTAKSEGGSSAVSFDLAGLSMEQLLELSTKALKEVSSRGVSNRSQDDVQAAEHEINEIKQDAAGVESSDPMVKSPVNETAQNPDQSSVEPQAPVSNTVDPSADSSMESVFAERDLPALISMYEKLGEHISARSEMQKNTQPKPAAPSAIAMMKSFQEGLRKSVTETIASEIKALFSEESKKVSSEIEAMKKSLNQVKKDLDSVPSSAYTSSVSSAKDNEKLLAKSLHETPEQAPAINKDELARRILSLQKSHPSSRVDFTRYVTRTALAKSYNELKQVQDELDGLNLKN